MEVSGAGRRKDIATLGGSLRSTPNPQLGTRPCRWPWVCHFWLWCATRKSLPCIERKLYTWTLKLPIKMGYHPIILGVKPIFKGILRVQVYVRALILDISMYSLSTEDAFESRMKALSGSNLRRVCLVRDPALTKKDKNSPQTGVIKGWWTRKSIGFAT